MPTHKLGECMENNDLDPLNKEASVRNSADSEASRTDDNHHPKVADSALVGGPTAAMEEPSPKSPELILPEWSLPRANFAATGGAVTAVALGLWACLTGWLTDLTILNALLGLAMGFWGLKSPRKRLALFGIGLNLLAILFSLIWRW